METKNPTTLPAWQELRDLIEGSHLDLRQAFEADPGRAAVLSFEAADLHVDMSRNLVIEPVVAKLSELAEQTGVSGWREAIFGGKHINNTENRAVLYSALRALVDAAGSLVIDGQDAMRDVHEVLTRTYTLAESVRGGSWKGITGKRIETVVNIGIGGSDLGPAMVYEALRPYMQSGLECRFVSSIDPIDVGEKTKDFDPETTLFITASRTFITLETLTNARAVRAWLLASLQRAGTIDGSKGAAAGAVGQHFVAVSTALNKIAVFGIDPKNAFGFWSWAGGRYSMDSTVGIALTMVIGRSSFEDFLVGFHVLNERFRVAPTTENVPLLMGSLNVWYVNFLGAYTHAVLPYSQYPHRFPVYLQQLAMEFNSKRVRRDGAAMDYHTGRVFWGEPGTNGQHTFYQLMYQGTRIVPADFITFAKPTWDLVSTESGVRQHELFLGNFFAQTRALASGKTAAEVRAEGIAEDLVVHRTLPGNRPSTSITAAQLTPRVLGELIALYETIIFVQGVIWGIDSFNQQGVELGKVMAIDLEPAIAGDAAALAATDPPMRGLLQYFFGRK